MSSICMQQVNPYIFMVYTTKVVLCKGQVSHHMIHLSETSLCEIICSYLSIVGLLLFIYYAMLKGG